MYIYLLPVEKEFVMQLWLTSHDYHDMNTSTPAATTREMRHIGCQCVNCCSCCHCQSNHSTSVAKATILPKQPPPSATFANIHLCCQSNHFTSAAKQQLFFLCFICQATIVFYSWWWTQQATQADCSFHWLVETGWFLFCSFKLRRPMKTIIHQVLVLGGSVGQWEGYFLESSFEQTPHYWSKILSLTHEFTWK